MRQVEQLKETCAPLESSDEQTLQEAGGWVACLDSCTGMMQLPGYFLPLLREMLPCNTAAHSQTGHNLVVAWAWFVVVFGGQSQTVYKCSGSFHNPSGTNGAGLG